MGARGRSPRQVDHGRRTGIDRKTIRQEQQRGALAILAAADVVDDRELTVGSDLHVERIEAGRHVVILAVYLRRDDFLAIDIEQSYSVGATLGDERSFAVGGDGYCHRQRWGWFRHRGGRLGGDRHCTDRFDGFAVDRQDSHGIVGTVGDQCQSGSGFLPPI
jgi:hypothetical protein